MRTLVMLWWVLRWRLIDVYWWVFRHVYGAPLPLMTAAQLATLLRLSGSESSDVAWLPVRVWVKRIRRYQHQRLVGVAVALVCLLGLGPLLGFLWSPRLGLMVETMAAGKLFIDVLIWLCWPHAPLYLKETGCPSDDRYDSSPFSPS
jgi:hypothetical protein